MTSGTSTKTIKTRLIDNDNDFEGNNHLHQQRFHWPQLQVEHLKKLNHNDEKIWFQKLKKLIPVEYKM